MGRLGEGVGVTDFDTAEVHRPIEFVRTSWGTNVNIRFITAAALAASALVSVPAASAETDDERFLAKLTGNG